LVLQVDCGFSSQTLRGSSVPAATGVHLPIVAASAQLRHGPAQA
jgi:hypothetical protein